MMQSDARLVPVDPESERRLRERGYTYRVVDMADDVAAASYARAAERGFLNAAPTENDIAQMRDTWAQRRNVGVFTAHAEAGAYPVATVNAWVAEMTVPGGPARSDGSVPGATVPMWAISMVTVDATHRRRGIARALLEGELRSAVAAGVPLAGLTVSEATIYGRYGFGPAIPIAKLSIDTRRAGWIAPESSGTVEYVEGVQLAQDLGDVHSRSRLARTGQIGGWPRRWLGMAGLGHAGLVKDTAVRGVRYLDAEGQLRGAMAFAMVGEPSSFRHSLSVNHLAAETDDALRALWSFAVHHDLVDRVDADLRPVDDAVVAMVADPRAVQAVPRDHGWLRILDLPAAFAARTYDSPFQGVLQVSDPYGFVEGRWQLTITGQGTASARRTDAEADIILGVSELSRLYAGGVSPLQLAAAGQITGSASAIAALGRALRVDPAPTLGIWY